MQHRHGKGAAGMSRWLLGCGVIAGPLFVAVFLGEGATRAGYNAKRHPVSLLALGPSGWGQTASFFVTGALVVCLAAGVWRALRASGRAPWGAFLVGLVGVGLLGAGLFPTDAALGYPPGTRRPAAVTTTGKLHLFCALLVFLGLPGACCVLARLFAR